MSAPVLNDEFASKKESVMVAPYALYDVLHAFHVNGVDCTVGKEDGSLVVYFMKRPERHIGVENEGVTPWGDPAPATGCTVLPAFPPQDFQLETKEAKK